MNLDEFLRQRSPVWQQLTAMLERVKRKPEQMTLDEIESLGRLYRMATADLALAQRDFPKQKITLYLNQLVGQAHTILYRSEPVGWRQLRRFAQIEFPQLYRGLLPYTSVAFALFAVAALVAFGAVWRDPDLIYLIAGPNIAPLVNEVEQGKLWTEIAPAARSAASATILTNNIQVTFTTFAGGITAGIFTVWILVMNGLSIGSIFGLLQAHELSAGLAEFVVAHGFVELSVIFVAGGCGLSIGDALLRPGLQSRAAALIQRARAAVQVILGCAPLLVGAGLIEGFVSPSGLPWWVKLAVGVATGAALHSYWLFAGREQVQP
ncbi:MAG: stage II sporulation protein M [Caldilineaceae bacterium]|nr:stage II sporulation protein M [Caldilineaceae bacterium]